MGAKSGPRNQRDLRDGRVGRPGTTERSARPCRAALHALGRRDGARTTSSQNQEPLSASHPLSQHGRTCITGPASCRPCSSIRTHHHRASSCRGRGRAAGRQRAGVITFNDDAVRHRCSGFRSADHCACLDAAFSISSSARTGTLSSFPILIVGMSPRLAAS